MANTTTTKVNRLGLTHRQTVMIVLLFVGTFEDGCSTRRW